MRRALHCGETSGATRENTCLALPDIGRRVVVGSRREEGEKEREKEREERESEREIPLVRKNHCRLGYIIYKTRHREPEFIHACIYI